MQEEKNKIVLMIKKLQVCYDGKYYIHAIGESASMESAIGEFFGTSGVTAFKTAMANGIDGRQEIDEFIIYTLPHSFAVLHTCQNPLIVFKGDEIIDIDEWWYSPFKKMLFESYKGTALTHFDDSSSAITDSYMEYLDYGYQVKCTLKDSDDQEQLFAFKTRNITFNVEN